MLENNSDSKRKLTSAQAQAQEEKPVEWQLFTAHGLVLIFVLNKPGHTIREIGLELNLTERSVLKALSDLEATGYLIRQRCGRRTYYTINENQPLKYPTSLYEVSTLPKLPVKVLREKTGQLKS